MSGYQFVVLGFDAPEYDNYMKLSYICIYEYISENYQDPESESD